MIERRALLADERYELRRVALHEAGHSVVSSHFGVHGSIRLQPVLDRSRGTFVFGGLFVPDSHRLDSDANRMCALAGVVAESIDGKWDSVVHVLAEKMMSAGDAKHAEGFERRHVDETIGLLKWLWAEVELRAKVAMEPWLTGPQVAEQEDQAPQGLEADELASDAAGLHET